MDQAVSDDVETVRGDDQGVYEDGVRRPWDETHDVVVIGFGIAGASAAIEARAMGADTLVIDRFGGGGATRLSAGVVYFGGGTKLQREAGWVDTPDDMFKYLSLETRDAVAEATLFDFCARSVENFDWLCKFGVPFPSSGKAFKTSYPPDECTLYFSGNELCHPYCDSARPAPRGHRALGKGLTGHLIFKGVQAGATAAGATVRSFARAERLVVDDRGDVIGVVLLEQRQGAITRAKHAAGMALANYGGGFSRRANAAIRPRLGLLASGVRRRFVRARGGVVLSAGGFVFNREMMQEHAPAYADCSMRLGTAADDGSGISMGRAAGGAIARMDRCCAWRFINPPSAYIRGVLIGPSGARICNEELYGSTIGEYLAVEHGGRGVLVLDHAMMKASREQLRSETMGGFQLVFGALNSFVNFHKAESIEALARLCGIDERAMAATVAAYNAGAETGNDALGKHGDNLAPVREPPYYAINCDIDTIKFPTPCITLGGLVVDGTTARVKRDGGEVIAGLYAAGRNAVGVSSHSYVSGLSVADGLYAGRNAGAHAARRAKTGRDRPVFIASGSRSDARASADRLA